MTARTLTLAFERSSGDTSRGLAVVGRRERTSRRSWSEIGSGARRVAAGLQGLGLAPGERVGLVYPTGFEFVEAFFGCVVAGAVPVPLYPPVRLGRLDEYHRRTVAMLGAVGADLLLCDGRVRRVLGETVAAAKLGKGCRILSELPDGRLETQRPTADDLCLIQFSSGTTVEPKPVALTHRAVMAQVTALNGFWPDGDDLLQSGVSWLPLYHDMGLIGCLLAAVERPGDLTLIPPELFVADPAIWLRTLSSTRATISPAPNFAYGLCVEKIDDDELSGVDLSHWRLALNGAETVVAGVVRAFCRRFSKWGFREEAMTPVYGLSEAALAVTFADLDRSFTSRRFARASLAPGATACLQEDGLEIVSVGRSIPGFAVSIRDRGGSEVGEREVGRVWVSGASLMSGYFGNESASAEVLDDGWLDTGDLGFVYDGDLYLTGRAKELLIVRGLNHLPHDLEQAVDGVAGARKGCSAAVSYLPEGAASEAILVLVERSRAERSADDSDLANRCRRAVLARTGLDAARVEILDPGTLPRTSSGKIRRRRALELFLEGRLEPPESVGPLRLLGKIARSRIALERAEGVEKRP